MAESGPPGWTPAACDSAERHARHAVEYLCDSLASMEVAVERESGVRLDVDRLEVREWLAEAVRRRLVATARK